MKAFLSTCLALALFLPEVTNIRCKTGALTPNCQTDGFCFIHYFKGYLNGSFVKSNITFGCTANCDASNYSFNVLGSNFRSTTICCQRNYCNELTRLDSPNYALNGLRCEFYDASDPNDCPKLRNLSCYADETRCIKFVLVHNDSSISNKVYDGCATPSFCELARTSPYHDQLGGTITEARCGDTLPIKKIPKIEE